MWIDVGDSVIYEYLEAHADHDGMPVKYNDYQLSRFLEDFFNILPYVAESILEYLYDSVDTHERDLLRWEALYLEKSDEEFSRFAEEQYEPLHDWFYHRSFDSGHLICGPLIGCFRFGERLKLMWDSDRLNDGRTSIWKYPMGTHEIRYSEFVAEISRFFDSFFRDMDNQVAKVVTGGIPGVHVDTDALVRENIQRRHFFEQKVNALTSEDRIHTDWDAVKRYFDKMMSEI